MIHRTLVKLHAIGIPVHLEMAAMLFSVLLLGSYNEYILDLMILLTIMLLVTSLLLPLIGSTLPITDNMGLGALGGMLAFDIFGRPLAHTLEFGSVLIVAIIVAYVALIPRTVASNVNVE